MEQKLDLARADVHKLLPLRQETEKLKNEIQTWTIKVEEKDVRIKSLQLDLDMAQRQLERIENQNRVFESISSDDSSDEENKSGNSNKGGSGKTLNSVGDKEGDKEVAGLPFNSLELDAEK